MSRRVGRPRKKNTPIRAFWRMKAREKKKKRLALQSQPVTSDPMTPSDPLLKLENPQLA